MKNVIVMVALVMVSPFIRGDFSCPDGTHASCLKEGDLICPSSTKCVAEDAICVDKQICGGSSNFVCESDYDEMRDDYKRVVEEYNELASENEDLRNVRLERKNCVINAASLKDAIRCVR
jgi:hypothetical protein